MEFGKNLLHLNCGTLKGRRRLLTTGGTWLDFGRAGLLAQRAALVNCETNEKLRSGPDVVRKTFLIFDLNPEDGGDRGAVGMGITCTLTNISRYPPLCFYLIVRNVFVRCIFTFPWSTFAASSGSLPHRQEVDLSRSRCLANLSITSAHTYLPQNLAHCSALNPLPWSLNVGFAPESQASTRSLFS